MLEQGEISSAIVMTFVTVHCWDMNPCDSDNYNQIHVVLLTVKNLSVHDKIVPRVTD